VFATVGVHPHEAKQLDDAARAWLARLLERPRVVAVGECGLDYWYEHSPRDAQREALRAQVRLARAIAKPLVIHVRPSRGTRDAFEEIVRIFDEGGAERVGGVIHCFTGDLPFAHDCLARGFDISFSGILTFNNAAELRAVAKALPLERLLVETDSPLLAPVPHRGRRNEPAWVAHVVACLAELHEQTPEAIGARTDARARALFRLGSNP
jgi:TatD DNase family protein